MATKTRTITPAEASRQRQNGTRIDVGIWVDVDGDLHFSVLELLAMVGLPHTAENEAAVIETIQNICRRHGVVEAVVQTVES